MLIFMVDDRQRAGERGVVRKEHSEDDKDARGISNKN